MSLTADQQIEQEERYRRALALRLSGASWDEVAAQVGYANGSAASRAVLARIRDTTNQAASEWRDLENARLERLLRGVWPRAINPQDRQQMSAVKQALDIIRAQRDLNGLDAPRRVDITTELDREIDDLLAELKGRADGSQPATQGDPAAM